MVDVRIVNSVLAAAQGTYEAVFADASTIW